MKFLIISHAPHKISNGELYAYAPYVREMNLWLKYVSTVEIVAPLEGEVSEAIDLKYDKTATLTQINAFNIKSKVALIKTLFKIPRILFVLFKAMKRADHIHLRCPGNIGLLGCFVQVLFPSKSKTVKYAGNWDPNSKQPRSYRLQKWIVSNTFLTKNVKVLVYGEWQDQSKNIVPFFTASYKEIEKEKVETKDFSKEVRLIFVGTLSPGKQPLISVQVAERLVKKGINVRLDLFGEGSERTKLEQYIADHQLENYVVLRGNQPRDIIKEAYKKSHFLVFISKSEGWPKVVAESMFWKCLPISTKVSCVPSMLDFGNRGSLVVADVAIIVEEVICYIEAYENYKNAINKAYEWSRTYTLDKFEDKIKAFLIES